MGAPVIQMTYPNTGFCVLPVVVFFVESAKKKIEIQNLNMIIKKKWKKELKLLLFNRLKAGECDSSLLPSSSNFKRLLSLFTIATKQRNDKFFSSKYQLWLEMVVI